MTYALRRITCTLITVALTASFAVTLGTPRAAAFSGSASKTHAKTQVKIEANAWNSAPKLSSAFGYSLESEYKTSTKLTKAGTAIKATWVSNKATMRCSGIDVSLSGSGSGAGASFSNAGGEYSRFWKNNYKASADLAGTMYCHSGMLTSIAAILPALNWVPALKKLSVLSAANAVYDGASLGEVSVWSW